MRARRAVATKKGELHNPEPADRGLDKRMVLGINFALSDDGLAVAMCCDKPVFTIDANPWRLTMQWTAPSFTDLRFGFEITMYIANR